MKLVVRTVLLSLLALAALTLSLLSFLPEPGEYEITSIDSRSWEVSARRSDGATLSFEMNPSVFKGRCFSANLTGVGIGERFSILGPPGERFDGLRVRSASGKPESPGKARGGSRRPSGRGMQEYCVVDVDAQSQAMTAKSSRSSEQIHFKVDSRSFRGYRLRVPSVGELAAGKRFSLTTPNDVPVRCCTLLERSN